MSRWMICIVLPLLLAQTRPAVVDPALWQRLEQINTRSAKVVDLTACFEQQKFTPMLEQPLVSHGTLAIRGPVMLWKTVEPEPTQMRIDPKQIQIYYPDQKTVEVYPIEQKLASLAAGDPSFRSDDD